MKDCSEKANIIKYSANFLKDFLFTIDETNPIKITPDISYDPFNLF